MRLNNETLIMVEYDKKHLRLHYADGHYEIVHGTIRDYMIKNRKGYKNPILIHNHYLYPTRNIQDISCRWINLELYEENNYYYQFLLENYDLESKALNMFLKQKKNIFDK